MRLRTTALLFLPSAFFLARGFIGMANAQIDFNPSASVRFNVNGRSAAQSAAVASVATYTVGSADGSFLVTANVNVTTATTHSFSVQVDYTDEANVARTLTVPMSQLAGTFVAAITNITGAGPYEGATLRIRCKAATAITIKTTGTFTAVVYNVEGGILQIS